MIPQYRSLGGGGVKIVFVGHLLIDIVPCIPRPWERAPGQVQVLLKHGFWVNAFTT